jgi:hypothetical protein
MRYQLEVSSRAHPGREEEYAGWYDDVHVGDVLRVPGFLSCQRYRRVAHGAAVDGEFVAIYEVECDNPQDLLQTLFAAAAGMRLTDAIDPSSPRFEFLQPQGPRRFAE